MLYCERELEGRGVGCVAVRTTEPGEVVVSEEPTLFLKSDGKQDYLPSVMAAFSNMTEQQQGRNFVFGEGYRKFVGGNSIQNMNH